MISVKTRTSPPNLAKTISDAPRNARGRMTVAAAKYLVGNGRRGLKHYPPYKYITRKRAYGKTFSSDRQRRFVMASIRAGRNLKTGSPMDPGFPHRTGRFQRGWQIREQGTKTVIYNDEPHAEFVAGDGTQARLNKMVGWRVVSKIAADNENGMVRAAEQELGRYLKEKGLT